MTTIHTNHTGIDTESGKHQGNNRKTPPNGVDRQQELLSYLCESETLAQHVLNTSPSSPLMEHAVQLCQGYLKTLLDMHNVWQRLQYARTQESSLGNQLGRMQEVLQEVYGQIRAETDTDEHKALQTSYWDNIGRLIDDVLHLSEADIAGLKELPHDLPLSEEVLRDVAISSLSPDKGNLGEVSSPKGASPDDQEQALKLSVHLFGEFKASLHDREIKRWPRGKGQKIFKYLLLHRATPVRKERLMETFWPDIETRAARNNLNVSIYYLRQDLSRYHKTFAFVSYRDDCYSLNSELSLWVDTEAFDQYVKIAQQYDARHDTGQAIASYRFAEALYQGDCLLDDDEEWASLIRQAYRMKYLSVLEYLGDKMMDAGEHQECATLWQKAVMLDSCNEQAHQRIMYCYWQIGQRQMALRQYQICEESLQKELGLAPAPQTRQLLEQIRQAGR